MTKAFSRHLFLNHRTAIVELLQEIEFIDEQKAIRKVREIETDIKDYRDFSFFSFSESRLVGLLFARPKVGFAEIGRTLELMYLSVRKTDHHKGIASELMEFMMSSIKYSYANVLLGCYEKNEGAIKFYTKFGFIPYRINKITQTRLLDKGTPNVHTDILFIRRLPLRGISIRPLRTSNVDFLKEMVFQSLYTEGELFDREILNNRDIARYYVDWDSKKEIGFIARFEEKDIGAIWSRQFPFYDQGYGYVDDHIPEMGIAVFPEYRGRGLGQQLMDQLFNRLRHLGVRGVSLSVHTNNMAKRAYIRNGFRTVRRDGNSLVMLKEL